MPDNRRLAGDGIHRLGDRYVNWYVVEEGGRLTVIDAGLPAHWDQLPRLLRTIGRSLADVTAVLLTHHHPDHLGCAERIRGEAQAPVLIHAADADGARRGGVSPPTLGVLRAMFRPPCARYLFSASQAGAGRVPPIAQLVTFADGERLDLPGRPRVIHTPGHTNGQCVLHLEERAVLFTGDALVTLDVGTGRIEPSLLGSPFTLDRVRAAASLERVEATRAAVLLPGHGDPWRDGVARAVQLARQPGRSPRLRGPASIPARRFRGSVRGQFATDASRQRW